MTEQTTEVIMPLMGEGITEATLVKWLKKPGDKLEKDEALLEVSTDKVDTEIPSPVAGYLLKTLVTAGETVAINSVIGFIGETPNAKIDESTQRARPEVQSQKVKPSTSSRAVSNPLPIQAQPSLPGTLRSSPLVRKIAREMNINLSGVAGRGLHGRITKSDILNFVRQVQQEMAGGVQQTTNQDLARLETTTQDGREFVDGVSVRREKMTKMRRLIAEHMVRSVHTSPHVTVNFEIDLYKVVALRNEHKVAFNKKHGFNITYTHLITHAAVQAIKKHPIVNTSVDGDDILFKDEINIGLAVALESGLLVPVIKNAGNMSLREVAIAANDLVTRARSKKLKPDEVTGGTFSITNPGGFGTFSASPIINQPQVAILCLNALIEKPVVVNQEIVIRPMMQIGLTFDHRVIDGEGGSRFLATLKEILESYEESPA